MKAIVIDDKPGPDCLQPDFHFGEEVTLEDVSGMAIDLTTGKEFDCKGIAVIVKEYSYCPCGCGTIELFSKKRFAPLSEEDNKVLDEQEAREIRVRLAIFKIKKSLERWQQQHNDEKF